MNDNSKNLAFLSRRVSALEKKVNSLETTVAENTVLIERLSEVVELTLNNQKYFKENWAQIQSKLKGFENCRAVFEEYFGKPKPA
ncbi:hypothetical protein P60_gp11 [Synechococcus phage P60]|uniref:Uncharacterized protein n=1 Tax=Synechococcus phage P60 TaxID=2905923 RepID=Q8W714_9CAUD|nr:hypothetical protein P60_gp11 [Synechococcus phage P60]AAL73263.1 hypothetical protein P60_gp11 [Synechococcus phage P60]